MKGKVAPDEKREVPMYAPFRVFRRLSKIPHAATVSLAALMLASAACATTMPGIAYAAGASQITDMTEQDYRDLGLGTSKDIPDDTVGPYSTTAPTTFVTRNEVYMAANGSHGNRYTLRDKLENIERGDIGGGSKLTDFYGSVWGAAKFWQNVNSFDTDSDLYKHSDYGGGTWSYLSDNTSSTILANDNNGFSGIHATSVEFCNDANTGKKSRVAELRAYGDSSSTAIDGKSYAGKVELVLYSFSNGRTRNLDTRLPVTVNTNMMYGSRFKYLDAGYLQEHDAVFDVEAGDVDGDGIDELFVYAGCYVDEGGVRKAIVDMYDLEGSNWKQSVVKIDAGNASDYTTSNKGSNDSWTQLQSVPVVSLAAGDLDRDFCDDLAIVVSAPYGKKNIVTSTHCELFSWDAGKGALVHVDSLGDSGAISLSSNGKTMVAANATFGTFAAYDDEGSKTGETVTGLIIAGYDWWHDAYDYGSSGDELYGVLYRYAYFDSASGEFKLSDCIEYRDELMAANTYYPGLLGVPLSAWANSGQDRRYPCTLAPVALAAANLDGLSEQPAVDELFVGGDVFRDFACNVAQSGQRGLGSRIGTASMSRQQYNDSNKYDHKGIEQVWISDVKAGSVSGSDRYNESFIAVVGKHRDEDLRKNDDYYWMTVSHFTLDEGGNVCRGEEQVISESNRRGTTYGTFISLALPDVDNDSVKIAYKDRYKVYTNPRVLAVLQDAPYVEDLEQAYGYLVLGGTSYGEGAATGKTQGYTIGAELGVAVDVQTGPPLVAIHAAVDFAAEGSYDYQNERTISTSVSYESHAGESDKAVLYTIPMVYYEYEIENEETGGKGTMAAPVSLGAQTSVVNVETYDRIAEQHNMTPLSSFLTSRSGEPGTYQTVLSGETPVGDSFGLGKPGVTRAYTHNGFNGAVAQSGASIEQTIEVEEGEEQELEIGLTLNGEVVGGGKLGKHEVMGGICFGANAGFTTGKSSSESTEYGGTVDNLPEAAQDKYGFVWRLGVNKVDVDKFEADAGDKFGTKDTDQFWIVGYDVKDVVMPDAPAVTGFTASSVDATSVTFAWDDVLSKGDGFSYGIGMLQSNAADAAVNSWKIADNTQTSLVWDGLQPNTEYRFAIAAVKNGSTGVAPVGIRSAIVAVKTMPEGMTMSVAGPTADVMTGADLGYDSSIERAAGDHLTFSALGRVTQRDAEGNETGLAPSYIWYRKGRGDTEFKRVAAFGDVAVGVASTLEIDLTANDDGAQYYCHVGYNDAGLDTGITLVNIAIEETKPSTVNAGPVRIHRLFSQASEGAKKFLDRSMVNTAGSVESEGPQEPQNPETPGSTTMPETPQDHVKPKKGGSAKTTVSVKKLISTGDRTFITIAVVASVGVVLLAVALIILLKRRKSD